jgi:hypothetical protein
MLKINASVGNKGKNYESDVRCIQKLLNKHIHLLLPLMKLKEDGKCGPITIGLISEYQRRILRIKTPDGRVDPQKETFNRLAKLPTSDQSQQKPAPHNTFDQLLFQMQGLLKATPFQKISDTPKASTKLTEVDYNKAAITLGVDIATVKAVAEVESMGNGFLNNGKPKILFEGHWFSKLTKNVHDESNPTISYKTWTKKNYLGNEKEYSRLNAAISLDREAALKSTSWGKFQIMGFNHKQCGYQDVESFAKDMYKSEHYHLMAFVKLIKSMKWDASLKAKDWKGFARKYNGPGYEKNNYDIKIQQAYKAFSIGSK